MFLFDFVVCFKFDTKLQFLYNFHLLYIFEAEKKNSFIHNLCQLNYSLSKMTVRKFAISLLWMLLIYINASVDSSPQYNSAKKPLHQPLQPINDVDRISAKTVNETVLHFLEDYKRLRAKKSEEAMRTIATAGLVSGALKVEELIRDNLGHLTDDLIDNFNVSTPKENMDKLLALEEVMERDKSSIDVLMSALEFARNSKSYESFNEDMKRILKEVNSFFTVHSMQCNGNN